MCDVDAEAVVAATDAPSIYEIPKVLHAEGLDAYVVRRLGLPFRDVDWTVWGDLLDRVHHPQARGHGGLVGKYVDLPDAYLSVTEALRAAAFAHRAQVTIVWVPSDSCETPAGAAAALAGVDGVVIPGGFGIRGIEGKVGAVALRPRARHPDARPVPRPAVHGDRGGPPPRRDRATPTRPSSTRTTPDPVIATMADQVDIVAGNADLGGTMRLGAYPAVLDGRLARRPRPTARTEVSERHRHRYEVNNAYRDRARGGRPGDLRHVAGRAAGRVRRAAARRAPVLRRHPGPPGAEVAPDPGPSAVPGVHRRRADLQRRRAAAGRDPGRRPLAETLRGANGAGGQAAVTW